MSDSQHTIIELTKEQVETALAQFDVTEAALAQIREMKDFTVAGPEDKKNLKIAKSKHKNIRELRIDIDKKRKELIRPALDFQSAVNNEAKRLTGEIKPVEDHLKTELDRIAKEKSIAKAKKIKERRQALGDAGFVFDGQFYSLGTISLHPTVLEDADDEVIQDWVEKGAAEKERMEKEEAEQKAREKRLKEKEEEIARKERELAKREKEAEERKQQEEAAQRRKEAAEAAKEKEAEEAEETRSAEEEKRRRRRPVTPPGSGRNSQPSHRPAPPSPAQQSQPEFKPTQPGDAFTDGFNTLRKEVMGQLKKGTLPDGEKITRKSLYNWLRKLDIEPFKPPF